MKRYIILFVLCLQQLIGLGQQRKDIDVWQLSGMVLNMRTEEPVPYVRVQINHGKRGILSNESGFYSIPVVKGDTVYFYSLGYSPSKLIVDDYLAEYQGDTKSYYLYSINYVKEDTFSLPVVDIRPYATAKELELAILNMDTDPNSPEAYARENLNPEIIDAIMAEIPADADERLLIARQVYYNQFQSRYLMPTASLNPIAAMRMLRYLSERTKRKKNKDLNYWEE